MGGDRDNKVFLSRCSVLLFHSSFFKNHVFFKKSKKSKEDKKKTDKRSKKEKQKKKDARAKKEKKRADRQTVDAQPSYTLTYFRSAGNAQGCRIALAAANANWENHYVDQAEWQAVKASGLPPFGQAPFVHIKYPDGSSYVLAESHAVKKKKKKLE